MNKILLMISCIGLSFPVYAQGNQVVFGEAAIAVNTQSTDDSRSDLDADQLQKLTVGLQVNDKWNVGLSYSESSADQTIEPYTIEYEPQDLTLFARYNIKKSNKWNLYTDFGVDFYRIKFTNSRSVSTGETVVTSYTDDGWGAAIALGASYNIRDNFALTSQLGYIARPDTFDESVNQHDLNTTYFGIGARISLGL